MALCTCSFCSHTLGSDVEVLVYIPTVSRDDAEGMALDEIYRVPQKWRTLTLLHGMHGNHTSWVRKTNVERYAEKHRLALVMPAVQNSFYTDMRHGLPYFTFLTEELPRFARAVFPLSDRREENFIAGLSMGGYGAALAALTLPERYGAFASLSGALDIGAVAGYIGDESERRLFHDVFGAPECFQGSAGDLFALAKGLKTSGKTPPRIYLCCGREDALCYPMNAKLRGVLTDLDIPLTWEEGPGAHDWDFWERYIARVLDWLDV